MYRLKLETRNGGYDLIGSYDKLDVGCNGLLAAVKAQLVADEIGQPVTLEKEAVVETFMYDNRVHGKTGWVVDEVFTPQVQA